MSQVFENWDISKNVPNELFFHKMEVDNAELLIFLRNLHNDDQIIKIKFEYYFSFRVTMDLALMKKVNKDLNFRGFARSKTSSYLNSIIEGSYNIITEDQFEHFLIFNLDNAIEVISDKPGVLILD